MRKQYVRRDWAVELWSELSGIGGAGGRLGGHEVLRKWREKVAGS